MSAPKFFNGGKIFFSPVNKDDIIIIFSFLKNSQLNNLYNAKLETLKDFRNELKKNLKSEHNIVFMIKNIKRQTVGMIGLYNIDFICHSAEIKFIFAKNKSISLEPIELIVFYGFDRINLNRISIDLSVLNKNFKKLLMQARFKFEGILRESINYNNKNYNLMKFSILRDEYFVDLYNVYKEKFNLNKTGL